MKVEEMNALQLGACVQAIFEEYWKHTNIPVKISSTWAGDLAIALWYEKHGMSNNAIQETIDDGFEGWKCNFDMCSQLIMAVNYLAWVCYGDENFKEYTDTFSRAYHSLLLQVEHHFSDDELSRLYEILN